MKTQFFIISAALLLLLPLILNSCTKKYKPRVKYKADISEIKASVEIIRFDLDLLSLDTANISEGLEKLKEKHGDFVKTFFKDILNDAKPQPIEEVAKAFISIPETKQLGDSIKKTFPDLNSEKKEIEDIIKYKTYFFGDKILPINKVYTLNTLYKYGAITYDNIAGIGLDFFLGENHIGYSAVENLRHQYKRRTLNSEHLSASLAASIAEFIVSETTKPGGSKLIDLMIYEGKKFFVKSYLMPEAADSIIYNFSDFQIRYCELGEVALWEHLGKENLLFSSKRSDYLKYVNEGPFNPKLDLPGNSGSWLGAQILIQNAKRLRRELKNANPSMSVREIDMKVIEQILKETNSQKLIQKYKPTKS